MKKLIALVLVLVCVLGLASCRKPGVTDGIPDGGTDIGVDSTE